MNIVAHNLQSMNANRQLGIVTNNRTKSTEKLASGYKINRAADDAAGLAISEKMRKQIRGLTQGTDNAQDGVSMCQIADGALAEVGDMLHRITELSVKSANGTNSRSDREAIQMEVGQILTEIDRISTTTKFNEEILFAREKTQEIETWDELSYDEAKKQLFDGSYRRVQQAVTLSDGRALSARDTNAISAMCSSIVILQQTTALRDLSPDVSWTDFYKQLPKTAPYIIENSRLLYSYAEDVNQFAQLMDENAKALLSLKPPIIPHTKIVPNRYTDIESLYGKSYASVGYDPIVPPFVSFYLAEGMGWFRDGFYSYTPDGSGPQSTDRASGVFTSLIRHVLRNNNQLNTETGRLINSTDSLRWYGESSIPNTGFKNDKRDEVIDLTIKTYMSLFSGNTKNQKNIPSNSWWIQSGADVADGISLEIGAMDTEVLGIRTLDVSTQEGALDALERTKPALRILSDIRSKIGAQQNRLEHTIRHQENTIENTQQSESRIRDTDMAEEMVRYAKEGILQQAGQMVLAQANQSNQGVLSLL